MRVVGFNGLAYNRESGGISKYIYYLLHHMLESEDRFDFHPLIFLPQDSNRIFGYHPSIHYLSVNARNSYERILRESLLWSRSIRQGQIDLLHSPISYVPLGCGGTSSIVTIHDLCHFYYNQNFTFLRRQYLKQMMKKSVVQAESIISVSEFTKQDMVNTLNVPAEKIHVIHEGIDTSKYQKKYSQERIESTLRAYGIDGPFFISIGHLEPRKNYGCLIKACGILKSRGKLAHKLVIVGRQNWGWDWNAVNQQVEALGLHDDIIFTRFVEDEDLCILMQAASMFITTSIYEGFGFTPLESMASGTPVAASNITSLPEVVGDAAELFDPYQPEDIASKILNIIESNQRSAELVAKGYENIKRFSWQNCCEETMKLYRESAANLPSQKKRIRNIRVSQKTGNQDVRVINDFGNEWTRFNQSDLNNKSFKLLFDSYFSIFPWDQLPEGAEGADIGCGNGRWAMGVAPRVGKLHCIDPSNAVKVAQRNLSIYDNCEFHQTDIQHLPFEDDSLDFAFCIGVLHHIPDTRSAMQDCVVKLKPGAPFLIYIYYNLDSKPLWYRNIWRISNVLRHAVSALPSKVKHIVCESIAACVYYPLARLNLILEKVGLPDCLPLSYYKSLPFYVMRNDSLDRFGTRLESRYSRKEIEAMMRGANMRDIIFSESQPHWVAVGFKADKD